MYGGHGWVVFMIGKTTVVGKEADSRRDGPMSWRNPLMLSQKVKGQGHKAHKQCRHGFLHSCECWLFLVFCALCTDHVTSHVFYCVIHVVMNC